jgi:1,4-alpha-glucan branching enzyme
MIIKKVSPKGRSVRVIFKVPSEVARNHVSVVGDFNDWDSEKHMMKFDEKTREWTRAISLKPGKSYQFRYVCDDTRWLNDESADDYVANGFFSENSVLTL